MPRTSYRTQCAGSQNTCPAPVRYSSVSPQTLDENIFYGKRTHSSTCTCPLLQCKASDLRRKTLAKHASRGLFWLCRRSLLALSQVSIVGLFWLCRRSLLACFMVALAACLCSVLDILTAVAGRYRMPRSWTPSKKAMQSRLLCLVRGSGARQVSFGSILGLFWLYLRSVLALSQVSFVGIVGLFWLYLRSLVENLARGTWPAECVLLLQNVFSLCTVCCAC